MTRHALLSTITRIVSFITFTVGFALTAFAPALGWRAAGLVVMEGTVEPRRVVGRAGADGTD